MVGGILSNNSSRKVTCDTFHSYRMNSPLLNVRGRSRASIILVNRNMQRLSRSLNTTRKRDYHVLIQLREKEMFRSRSYYGSRWRAAPFSRSDMILLLPYLLPARQRRAHTLTLDTTGNLGRNPGVDTETHVESFGPLRTGTLILVCRNFCDHLGKNTDRVQNLC